MDRSDQTSEPGAMKRRKFHIQSKFGEPRQWRSRKSRPCDACRRRKTACVIDRSPPCRYCESKGLACLATAQAGTDRARVVSSVVSLQSPAHDVPVLDADDDGPVPDAPLHNCLPSITVLADAAASLAPVETAAASLPSPWPVADASLPIEVQPAGDSFPSLPSLPSLPPASAVPPAVHHGASPPAPAAPVSSACASICTLEDNPQRTAHSMGLAGEQDAELMVSFRYSVMSEVNQVDADIMQVYAGDLASSQPPVHFNLLHDSFAPLDNVAKDAASDRIEAAVAGHADELVRLYFRHVHPVYPILAKTRFLEAYFGDADVDTDADADADAGDMATESIGTATSPAARPARPGKLSLPASVRGVVYGLASNFWLRDPANAALPLNQHELFEDALASLQREFHGPDLWTVQACLLLIHENSAENATIETPRVWTLAAQTVACAQVIGLHRDPTSWSIAPWEKSLRTKLWWATCAADVWSAVCHGNPPHIYRDSFTTPALSMDDLAMSEDVPHKLARRIHGLVDRATMCIDIASCARLFQSVAVSRIVQELLHSSFSDVTYRASMQNPPAREAGLVQVRQKLEHWASLLPRCLDGTSHNNGPVHLAYYAAVALTFRALMSPVTKAAKQDAQSSLRRYFGAAMDAFRPFIDFMNAISPACMHAFWGLHARSQLILCGNFFIYLFLLAPDPAYVQDAFQLLGSFHDSLQRLSAVADKYAISILRPVALRIDSFFVQAAQIMRSGQCAETVPVSPHMAR